MQNKYERSHQVNKHEEFIKFEERRGTTAANSGLCLIRNKITEGKPESHSSDGQNCKIQHPDDLPQLIKVLPIHF